MGPPDGCLKKTVVGGYILQRMGHRSGKDRLDHVMEFPVVLHVFTKMVLQAVICTFTHAHMHTLGASSYKSVYHSSHSVLRGRLVVDQIFFSRSIPQNRACHHETKKEL